MNPATGPSLADLTEQAAAVLETHRAPLLAQAVRQLAAHNRDLAAQAAELDGLLHTALGTGDTYGRMYTLAAQDTAHYRRVLERIAHAPDIEQARKIATGALA